MSKLMALSMVAALVGACQVASAQDAVTPSLKEGTKEIVVGGSYDPNSLEGTTMALSLRGGYFIQDNIEVGGSLAYKDADEVGTAIDVSGFAEYNFNLGTELVPFVGAEVAYRYLDYENVDTDSAIVGTVSGGVKYFLASNVAIRAALNGSFASEDVYTDEDGEVTDNDFNVTLGMAFYLP